MDSRFERYKRDSFLLADEFKLDTADIKEALTGVPAREFLKTEGDFPTKIFYPKTFQGLVQKFQQRKHQSQKEEEVISRTIPTRQSQLRL